MGSLTIPGILAWKTLASSQSGRWQTNIARFSESLALVDHTPKFGLSEDDTYFCIGSCFARNVEEHLLYCGRTVLSKRIISPASESGGRVNSFVNKFTTNSILNEIDWVRRGGDVDESLFEEVGSGWLDLQLYATPVTLERAVERRRYLMRDYFSRLRSASVVILTLGLNEVWFDTKSERFLNIAPQFYSVRRDPDRYQLHVTDVAENLAALNEIRSALKELRPTARIIITVSPVPMGETFTGEDVAVANSFSKATLRVAASTFAREHSDVDYFPTFDMIALSPRALAYGADCLHVSDGTVRQVMAKFLELYIGETIPSEPFAEIGYLIANPDVENLVRRGELDSGFQHWCETGRLEGRALSPQDGPTELMKFVGVA